MRVFNFAVSCGFAAPALFVTKAKAKAFAAFQGGFDPGATVRQGCYIRDGWAIAQHGRDFFVAEFLPEEA